MVRIVQDGSSLIVDGTKLPLNLKIMVPKATVPFSQWWQQDENVTRVV